jgi:hypothetical protein
VEQKNKLFIYFHILFALSRQIFRPSDESLSNAFFPGKKTSPIILEKNILFSRDQVLETYHEEKAHYFPSSRVNAGTRVARFFFVQNTKTGKIYQFFTNYTKFPKTIRNAIEYNKRP